MINKLQLHAAHLLDALKNSIPAVLLLGSLSLASAPGARAQILFSIDEFTTDTLTMTLQPGSLAVTNGATAQQYLYLVDGEGSNTLWISGDRGADAISGGFQFSNLSNAIAANDSSSIGDFLVLTFVSNLSTAGNLLNPITVSFNSEGLFSPSAVDTFALYWGDPVDGLSTFQSSGAAMTGGGSAVPEPGAYAIFACLAVMAFTVARRRGRAAISA